MIKPTLKPRRRVSLWIEYSLLAAGTIGLGLWAGSILTLAVSQDWQNWAFDRTKAGQPATMLDYLAATKDRLFKTESAKPVVIPPPVQKPHLANKEFVGRLTIPRLHLRAIVREGVGQDTLGLAVGHIPGTAFPGEDGNVAVAGHRDTLFRGLRSIRQDDLIQFETLNGSYQYQVSSVQIAKPEDVSVLRPDQFSVLTLVTCYPFNYVGSAPDRFIVKARQIGATATSAGAESMPEAPPLVITPPQIKPAPVKAAPVKPGVRRIPFNIARNKSRQLTPGISLGIDDTDVSGRRANGWIWLTRDRRTVWLKKQRLQTPLVIYGLRDGERYELRLTNITRTSVSGYLLHTPSTNSASASLHRQNNRI